MDGIRRPTAQELLGPLFIGTILNSIFFGICVVQSFTYYRRYSRDANWIRYFVLWLFGIEVVNTVLTLGMIYEPLIINFGQAKALTQSPILLMTNPLTTALISTSAQLFIAYRIKILSCSFIMPSIIALLGMTSLGGAITVTFLAAKGTQYSDKLESQKYEAVLIVWLATSAVADILIGITLSWSLTKRKTGWKVTDDKVAKIIRLTVHTGIVTAVLALADLIVAIAVPGSTYNFIWNLMVSKVYANALLSTLNARPSSGSHVISSSGADDNVLFGKFQTQTLSFHRAVEMDSHFNNRDDGVPGSPRAGDVFPPYKGDIHT